MGHHHDHSHSHHHHTVSGKNLGITILLNVLITAGQVVGGILSGSMALLTDALHNFSDVVALVLSYVTNRIAKRKSTVKQTYGFKRAEILSAFVNSAVLIGISVFLIAEAVKRFVEPTAVGSDMVIWFALASIVFNFVSVLILQKDSKENLNVRSAYLHLLTDVMTSVAVMLGGILMKFYGVFWVDPLLSVIIAVYLIYSSYGLLVQTIKILMQFTPSGIDINKISDEIVRIEHVKNLHHVHVWQLDEKHYFLEAHVDMQDDITISEFQKILKKIERILADHHITHYNIQPELDRDDDKGIVAGH